MDIGAFAMQYAIYIIAIVVVLFFGFKMFVNVSSKARVLKRGDLEKKLLIKSMELNKTKDFKELWHSGKFLGKILNYKLCVTNPANEKIIGLRKEFGTKYKEFGKDRKQEVLEELDELNKGIKEEFEKAVVYIVFKPKFIGKILNPFKKEVLQIFNGLLIKEYAKKKLIIPTDVSCDEFMGIFYDMTDPQFHLNMIKENMFKNDMKGLASIYYVEAQKQATINLDQAKAMELLEKQLQIEQAKRERVLSG